MTAIPAAPQNPSPEPPLNQPYYGVPFWGADRRFFVKYATFSGRASRSEFWWWFLASAVVSAIISLIGDIGGGAGTIAHGPTPLYLVMSGLLGLWALATIVPNLALAWRRLHDTNRSGGWWFLNFIPIVGWIIVIVFQAGASQPAGARFDR